ncbi:hypothetical protein MKZ38_007130 [Zalerion maritima]|uniref:Peptidase S54 rhomboid domain-containing protein n=1 Tax=Zalerion maritima TaxID=339359 RepID=A0AAD5RUY8_9PEZI|nr:hypothetical protein MKZ38_007130 [Zalerion maritima]
MLLVRHHGGAGSLTTQLALVHQPGRLWTTHTSNALSIVGAARPIPTSRRLQHSIGQFYPPTPLPPSPSPGGGTHPQQQQQQQWLTSPGPAPEAAPPETLSVEQARRFLLEHLSPYQVQALKSRLPKPKGRWTLGFILITMLCSFTFSGLVVPISSRVMGPEALERQLRAAPDRLLPILERLESEHVDRHIALIEADGFVFFPDHKEKPGDPAAQQALQAAKSFQFAVQRLQHATSLSVTDWEGGNYFPLVSSMVCPVKFAQLVTSAVCLTVASRRWMALAPGAGLFGLAFGSGLSANAAYLVEHKIMRARDGGPPSSCGWDRRAGGASGMISGITAAALGLGIRYGVFRPSLLSIGTFIAMQDLLDMAGINKPRDGDGYGPAGHAGGAAFGLLYLFLRRGRL